MRRRLGIAATAAALDLAFGELPNRYHPVAWLGRGISAAEARLPKETDAEKSARSEAMQATARHAAEVPMETARCAAMLLSRVPLVAEKGNPNAASDAGVAALLLASAAEGALLNVGINLGSIRDPACVQAMEKETAKISGDVERLRAQVIALVRKTFAK